MTVVEINQTKLLKTWLENELNDPVSEDESDDSEYWDGYYDAMGKVLNKLETGLKFNDIILELDDSNYQLQREYKVILLKKEQKVIPAQNETELIEKIGRAYPNRIIETWIPIN